MTLRSICNTENTATEKAGYEAPKIVTHSAKGLEGVALAVNACTGFTRSSGGDGGNEEENTGTATTY